MGTVASGFSSTFRDYNTDGVPASGAHNIVPSDCRGLGATIESYVAALIAASIPSIPVSPPGGRLTLITGTPVLSGNFAGATTLYYTPYLSGSCPLWNGTAWVQTPFSETSQLLSDSSKSPAAAAINSVYDLFAWNDGGTVRVTRGPAWASSISRGTGAGTSQLTRQSGFLVNQFAVLNGPAAGYGLYVGTIATNGAGTIDYTPSPAAASGGGMASLNVWNMFNRVLTLATVIDNGVVYSYTTNTVRAARGSATFRVNYVCGAAEDAALCDYNTSINAASVTGYTYSGIGLDSTTSYYNGVFQYAQNTSGNQNLNLNTSQQIAPQIGSHYISALEQGDGTHTMTLNYGFNGALQVTVRN